MTAAGEEGGGPAAAVTSAASDGGGEEAAAWMRAEMGLDLARRRRDAGLSQEQFAGLTRGYSRATVSHAELGTGRISRDFWLATDRVLGTGGLFAGLYDEVRECVEPRRRAVVRDGGPGMRCELALKSAEPDRALAGYRRLGWPVAARADVLELVAGRTADVLEVGRLAGAVAAGAWLESGGAAGTVRGLPALPPPDGALAVVDAGEHWFFLVRAGFPWPGGVDRACPAPGAAEIRWHSAGGRVPMPPSKAGRAATRWAYLPAAVVQLAPPLALLDLLGWAVAMTRVPGMLRLPGGAVVAPAGSQS